jgi:glyoxylase-like metal-dependent hydrolase (beta-lactamase superfamily II)
MPTDPSWREVAADVFVRAYDHLDVNSCVIRGGQDLLLVDSRSSPPEAAELEEELEVFAPARVRVLVNTHAHFDHTFGNQQFGPGSALDVPIYGHHRLPAHLDEYERPRLAAWRAGTGDEPPRDWHDVRITAPSRLLAEPHRLAIGDRVVELHPLGPGHTDTDLVVHVPDAGTWIVGDVVEASGPPMYGSGCFPLELSEQLASLLRQLGDADVVVPGHGPVVDRAFVQAQHVEVEQVAEQLRRSHRSGETVEQALADQDRWPFPVEGLELAVHRAFHALDQEG